MNKKIRLAILAMEIQKTIVNQYENTFRVCTTGEFKIICTSLTIFMNLVLLSFILPVVTNSISTLFQSIAIMLFTFFFTLLCNYSLVYFFDYLNENFLRCFRNYSNNNTKQEIIEEIIEERLDISEWSDDEDVLDISDWSDEEK